MENYSGFNLKQINSLFKDIFERRQLNYFDKKVESGDSCTPLTHFLKSFCNSDLNELLLYSKVKSTSEDTYYLFILNSKVILTKDYEDPCALNFCIQKNPIILSINIEHIENMVTNSKEKKLIQLSVSAETQLRGNLM